MKSNLKFAFSGIMVAVFFAALLTLPGLSTANSETTVPIGGYLSSLAILPDGKSIYVTNSEVVSVIDTSTNKLSTTIKTGDKPWAVAVSPDGKYAYAINRDSYTAKLDAPYQLPNGLQVTETTVYNGSVSIINTATNSVQTTVMSGGIPWAVAVSPDGNRVYVLNLVQGTQAMVEPTGGELLVINTATNTVSSTLSLEGGLTLDLAVSPDGKYVYVARDMGFVSVIDASTNTETTRINVGGLGLNGVTISPDGTSLYVAGTTDVYVVNTKSNAVTATITGLGGPSGVAVSPNGNYAYVTESSNNSISIINTDTNRVESLVRAGVQPKGIVISPNGKYAYVATNDSALKKGSEYGGFDYVGAILVISTDPNAVGTTTPSSEPPTENPTIADNAGYQSPEDNVGSQNPINNDDLNTPTADSSLPFDTLHLLIIVSGAVVVVVGLLAVVRVKRGSTKTQQ